MIHEVGNIFQDYIRFLEKLPLNISKKQVKKGIHYSMETLIHMDEIYRKEESNWNVKQKNRFFKNYQVKILAAYFSFKSYYRLIKKPAFKYYSKSLIEKKANHLKKAFLNHKQYSNFLFHSKSINGSFKIKAILLHFKQTVYFIQVPQGLRKYAKMKSSFYLSNYLKRRINQQTNSRHIVSEPSHLYWKSSKTDLVELIYALHISKSISGYSNTLDLVQHIEQIFNIKIGQPYKTYHEICNRNSGTTKFLDRIAQELSKQCLDLD